MSIRAEIASLLNGSTYPLSVTNELRQRAKAAGLVIVYGASDDLMEFDGVFRDEVDCYEGGAALVDAIGVLNRESIDDDDDDAIHAFVERKKGARTIEAVWDQDGYSWIYRTEIPHDAFEVLDDGENYCRGIVFSVTDL